MMTYTAKCLLVMLALHDKMNQVSDAIDAPPGAVGVVIGVIIYFAFRSDLEG